MSAEHARQEVRRAEYLQRSGRHEELDQHLRECLQRAEKKNDHELAAWAWRKRAERGARQ
jgi:hypothetical protein